ncbi:MAG: TetR/AcrR family transcriptional regulator [Pyrinomonadaceae bacterium]
MNEDSISTKITSSTGNRMAADERRSQILQIAVQLFSQHGFRGTTTREIAAAAQVSEAMVFRHFATKQELYSAIIDFKACEGGLANPCELLSEFIAAGDDYAVFYNLAINALSHHHEDKDFMRLLLFSALEGHELAELFFDRYIVHFYEFLGAYIEQRQKEGIFRQLQPRLMVRSFLGMVIHHSLNNSLWDKDRRLLNVSNEEAARQFTEILLRGVKIKSEKEEV